MVLVTHFMEEAEHLCDRVAIVDQGRVVATGTPSELVGQGRRRPAGQLHLAGRARRLAVPSRRGGAGDPAGRPRRGRGSGPLAVRVAAALAGRGIEPADFRTHHPDLEDVFLALTGRDLRA